MYYCTVIALFDPCYLLSKVENIHQVIIKKLLPALVRLLLLDINVNFITLVGRVLSKGAQRGGGARLKREGPALFLDLIVPYIYYILLSREVGQALWSPPLAKPHPISARKSASLNP